MNVVNIHNLRPAQEKKTGPAMDQKALRLECALAGPNADVSRVPAKCWVEIKSMKLTRMILSGIVEEFEFTTPDGEYAFCVWRGEVPNPSGRLWAFDAFALTDGVEDSGIAWVRGVPKESLMLQCDMEVWCGALLVGFKGTSGTWLGSYSVKLARLPDMLRMKHIEAIAKKWAIKKKPKMVSRNQVVHLVLEGFNGPVKPSTLVWNRTLGNKVTKRLSRKTCVEGRWFEKRLASLRLAQLNARDQRSSRGVENKRSRERFASIS